MKKLSSLKECIKALVVEAYRNPRTKVDFPKPPFELIDPVNPSGGRGQFELQRRIPLKLTPEVLALFDVNPEDTNDGILDDYFDMTISADPDYAPGDAGNRYGHPDSWRQADPEEFSVDDYRVVTIYTAKGQMGLSDEDGARLAEYLGPLTDDEVERIRDEFLGDTERPDPPSGRYDD